MTSGVLIQGDDDAAIRALSGLNHCRGEVICAYLHPPRSTVGWAQNGDVDRAAWANMMRTRLRLVSDLLAPDGSVWVFLNDDRLVDCRVLMDKIFGRSNFVATVVVQRSSASLDSRLLSTNHDYLLVFAKDATIWSPNRIPRTGRPPEGFRNRDNDPRGPWRPDALFHSGLLRSALRYEVTSPSGTVVVPPQNGSWRYSRQRFVELELDNRISWSTNSTPRLKRFYSELPDLIPLTVWEPADVGSSRDAHRDLRLLLPSEPEAPAPEAEQLVHRVFTVSTKPGDLVLDCFGRAGTATAVAHKTGRRWVTIANESYDIRARLDKVIAGEDPTGITRSVNWLGGGGYEVITTAAPAAEEFEETISLAEAIADGRVPTPVFSYREDRNSTLKTRLADACLLRETEEVESSRPSPPKLYVICETLGEISEVAAILNDADRRPGASRAVLASDGVAGVDVRTLIGNAKDAADLTDVAVVASYHPLSPELLGRVLTSLSGIGRIHLIMHDNYADLLARQHELFELRLPVRSLRSAQPADALRPERLAPIRFPLRTRATRGEPFSLSHITDKAAYTAGMTVRHKFPVPLVRQELYAERTWSNEIARGTRPVAPGAALERFVPVADVRQAVETKVHRQVASAPAAMNAVRRITEQFFRGANVMGDEEVWSERRKQLAITAVTRLVAGVHKGRRTGSQWTWQVVDLPQTRPAPQSTTNSWATGFRKGAAYDGWTKSIEPAVSFDAKSTEFRIARLCEDAPSVARWLRLDESNAYIEMEDGGKYYPDFVVVDVQDIHWLVEAKANRDADRSEVRAKREAAEEWATFVRDDGEFGVWHHLFVTEHMIKQALTWDELVARAQDSA